MRRPTDNLLSKEPKGSCEWLLFHLLLPSSPPAGLLAPLPLLRDGKPVDRPSNGSYWATSSSPAEALRPSARSQRMLFICLRLAILIVPLSFLSFKLVDPSPRKFSPGRLARKILALLSSAVSVSCSPDANPTVTCVDRSHHSSGTKRVPLPKWLVGNGCL